jgi:hypothetical protein
LLRMSCIESGRGMEEGRSVSNGTAKRPSGPATGMRTENRSRTGGELRVTRNVKSTRWLAKSESELWRASKILTRILSRESTAGLLRVVCISPCRFVAEVSPNVMPLSRYQKRESSVKTRRRLKRRGRPHRASRSARTNSQRHIDHRVASLRIC